MHVGMTDSSGFPQNTYGNDTLLNMRNALLERIRKEQCRDAKFCVSTECLAKSYNKEEQ